MKLNITPGPWTQIGWDIKFKTELTIANALVLDDAAAIVTAVNNTYHKGINPEAVEELLQVTKALYKQNLLSAEAQENLNRIIQKATLCLTTS